MDRSELVTLVSETWTTNSLNVPVKTETPRDVFANVSSVTQTEWFNGARQGLNPELRFTMFRFDYADEKIIEYNDNRYTIYRTYIGRDDTIELYAQRKQGNVVYAEEDEET